jgi:hypothetical protein
MICVCGHVQKVHRWGCDCCWTKDKTGALICPCREFKLDNLKYLEEKYNDSL